MDHIFNGIRFIFRGGFMMYPLLGSALLALTVILERFYVFLHDYRAPAGFTEKVLKELRTGQRAYAEQICRAIPTPIGDVLAAGLEHLDNPPEEMDLAMKNAAEAWIPLLEKRIHVIDTIITAAPLMGLLGTITGMMSSFKVLSEQGVNDPTAVTGGVGEALIATATGLVIALLSLGAFNALSAMVKQFIYEMESAASRLMEVRMALHRKRTDANTPATR